MMARSNLARKKLSKRKNDYLSRVNQALMMLNEVAQDNTTPRNIRRAAKEAADSLQASEYGLGVRASNTISIMD